MVIRQGQIFWLDLGPPSGSAPGSRHPHVVVQNDLWNESRIRTVVVAAITSNLRRAKAPGNVLLEAGEGNLTKRCVVNVSQLVTVDKEDLASPAIGELSAERVRQIASGLTRLFEPSSRA